MEQTKNLKLYKTNLQDIISSTIEKVLSDNFDIIDEKIYKSMENANLYVELSIDIPESFEISTVAGVLPGEINLVICQIISCSPDYPDRQMSTDWSVGNESVLTYRSINQELIDISDISKKEYTYEMWCVFENGKGTLYFRDKSIKGIHWDQDPINYINLNANTACIYIGDITLTKISNSKYQADASGLKSFFTTWEQFKLNSPSCTP